MPGIETSWTDDPAKPLEIQIPAEASDAQKSIIQQVISIGGHITKLRMDGVNMRLHYRIQNGNDKQDFGYLYDKAGNVIQIKEVSC